MYVVQRVLQGNGKGMLRNDYRRRNKRRNISTHSKSHGCQTSGQQITVLERHPESIASLEVAQWNDWESKRELHSKLTRPRIVIPDTSAGADAHVPLLNRVDLEKLAYWIGHRLCRSFTQRFPEDFHQAVEVALLEAVYEQDIKAASNVIRRYLYETLKNYGYRRAPNNYTWILVEGQILNLSLTADTEVMGVDHEIRANVKPVCGVPTCCRESSGNDKKYQRVCSRCYLWANKRKRKGCSDVYEGIEKNALLHP